jgi:hypothetical protein
MAHTYNPSNLRGRDLKDPRPPSSPMAGCGGAHKYEDGGTGQLGVN